MEPRWRIIWEIDESLVDEIRNFCAPYLASVLVRNRIAKNVNRTSINLSKEHIWKALIMCLITSNQKSGPGSRVHQFLCLQPFTLSLDTCINEGDGLANFASPILSRAGLRMGLTIGERLQNNLHGWQESNWLIIDFLSEYSTAPDARVWERQMANQLCLADSPLKVEGLGPKQARNFLQILGLTQYEIPIDSTILYHLNNWGFPIRLSSTLLSDPAFYEMVNDAVISLAEKLGMQPCVFDACLFASEYAQDWTAGNLIF